MAEASKVGVMLIYSRNTYSAVIQRNKKPNGIVSLETYLNIYYI